MATFLMLLLLLVSVLMILVVLVQRGRGGGLAGAFGSGGGSNSAFGTKTGDVFTTVTVVFFVVFMLLSVGLSFTFRAQSNPKPTSQPAIGTETTDGKSPASNKSAAPEAGGAGAGNVMPGVPTIGPPSPLPAATNAGAPAPVSIPAASASAPSPAPATTTKP